MSSFLLSFPENGTTQAVSPGAGPGEVQGHFHLRQVHLQAAGDLLGGAALAVQVFHLGAQGNAAFPGGHGVGGGLGPGACPG